MYEVMRYWDDDHPEWDAEEHAFAAAWRNQPKWVVSRSLKSVGPNARLVEDAFHATGDYPTPPLQDPTGIVLANREPKLLRLTVSLAVDVRTARPRVATSESASASV